MVSIPERCWIIASGDTDRSYPHLCLQHGVILMGPSYTGDWRKTELIKGELMTAAKRLEQDNWSPHKITNLGSFIEDIKKGDLIVLRLGIYQVYGIGIVVSDDYKYDELFADIDGWNIAHTHRVKWIWQNDKGELPEAAGILRRGNTHQRLYRNDKTENFFKWLESLSDKETSLPSLARPGEKLAISDITRKLFHYGLGTGSLSDIEDRINDLRSLAEWYKSYKLYPSENETVSHLVNPLLQALGWTSQRIQMEYPIHGKRVDVALYMNGNRKNYEPVAFIEAKKFGSSCLKAEGQIKRYAEDMLHIRRLIVTDGIRYGIFAREGNEEKFPEKPSAYLNLTDLRDEYPVFGACKGADEALLYMSAAWSHRFKHPDTPNNDDENI